MKTIISILFTILLTSCSSHKKIEIKGVDGYFFVPKEKIIGKSMMEGKPYVIDEGFSFRGCWGSKSQVKLNKDGKCEGPDYLLDGSISTKFENYGIIDGEKLRGSHFYNNVKEPLINAKNKEMVIINISDDNHFITKIGDVGDVYGFLEAKCYRNVQKRLLCERKYFGDEYMIKYTFYIGNQNKLYDEEFLKKIDSDVVEMLESWRVIK